MARLLTLLIFSFFGALSAHACTLDTVKRPSQIAAYLENGLNCLDTPPGRFRFDPEIERSFVEKINLERQERGLTPLLIRSQLRPAARFHSLDMGHNGFFGHRSPSGRGHADRISAFDRTVLTTGSAENVAQFGPATCLDSLGTKIACREAPGFRLPSRTLVTQDLHRKLMDSEGHRRNILDPDMTHIAVGVARTDTGFYVTQLFIRQAGELDRPLPVSLTAGSAITVNASVPGWHVRSAALSKGRETTDLADDVIPMDVEGERHFRVRAENRINRIQGASGHEILEWIYPSGPAITVVGATEN